MRRIERARYGLRSGAGCTVWWPVLVSLMLMASTAGAAGQAEVEGAFGLEFGQVLDIAGRPDAEVDDGGLRFPHHPEHPYDPLSDYTVTITPESRRVYMIRAVGHFSSLRRCREELITLEEVLEKKYVKTSGKISEHFGDMPEIRFGVSPRKIYGHCEGGILNKRLVLTYIDEALAEAARREARRESTDGDPDTSGL